MVHPTPATRGKMMVFQNRQKISTTSIRRFTLFSFLLWIIFAVVRYVRIQDNHSDSYPQNSNKLAMPVVDLGSPPMGFMSWERFRCETDCNAHPDTCISEQLYMSIADAFLEGGYVEAGYTRINIDDCWMASNRDSATQKLVPDQSRFPRGIKWLSTYMQERGLILGIYSDVGTHTCGGYPGSQGYETLDAKTFADWRVGYLKLDGCYMNTLDYPEYYAKWGAALKLVATQQPIVYSCSWPAYLGVNESSKPFAHMYNEAGCNTWRNYGDIDNNWGSLKSIIQHWAKYWKDLRDFLPQGGFHDADMLIVGDDHYGNMLTLDQARVQMGFWAIIASPLFIGGDVRTIPTEYKAILLNRDILAINQDVGRHMGSCMTGCPQSGDESPAPWLNDEPCLVHVWRKELLGGHSVAFGFFNVADDEIPVVEVEHVFPPGARIAKCHDLWAPGGMLINLCREEMGLFTSAKWDLKISPTTEGSLKLSVRVKDMRSTSHEMLRIDLLEKSSQV